MPEICRFYGIVIKMFMNDHAPPHFHVVYNDEQAVFSIKELKIIEGNLPKRVTSLVLEWAFSKREELIDNWERREQRKPLLKIAPLE